MTEWVIWRLYESHSVDVFRVPGIHTRESIGFSSTCTPFVGTFHTVDHTIEIPLSALNGADASSTNDVFWLSARSIDIMLPCFPGLIISSSPNSCVSLWKCSYGGLICSSFFAWSFPLSSLKPERRPLFMAGEEETWLLPVQLRDGRNERLKPVKRGRRVVRQAQVMAMVGSI